MLSYKSGDNFIRMPVVRSVKKQYIFNYCPWRDNNSIASYQQKQYDEEETNKIDCLAVLLVFSAFHGLMAQQYSRGTGMYTGNPKEFFGAVMKIDAVHYRNIALHKAAYQSDAYDYNLTAQLIIDGIIDANLPGWIVASSNSQGILPRDGREHGFDRDSSSLQFEGAKAWFVCRQVSNDTYQLRIYLPDGFTVNKVALSGGLEATKKTDGNLLTVDFTPSNGDDVA